MGGISLVISEPGLKEQVCTGGWRGRGSAPGGCIAPVTQSDVHRWQSRTRWGSPTGRGDSGTGNGVGKHRRGRWCREARSGPGRVPHNRSKVPRHPKSHRCRCSPCLPRPAAPPAPTGAMVTNPPCHPAPRLQARSRQKPRCFLRMSFLAGHYANPLTPKDVSFLFSPALACSGEPAPQAEAMP